MEEDPNLQHRRRLAECFGELEGVRALRVWLRGGNIQRDCGQVGKKDERGVDDKFFRTPYFFGCCRGYAEFV